MAQKYIIVGMGEFGLSVCKRLNELHMEVLAIDKDPEKAQFAQSFATSSVAIDATDENALKAIGVSKYDVAVVSIGTDLESSVMITVLLKEMGIEKIVAKAVTGLQEKVLMKIGADRVVLPEVEGGKRLANSLVGPNILDSFEFSGDVYYIEFRSPKSFTGKSIIELKIRNVYNLNVIGVKSNGDVNLIPSPDTVIKENDILMVMGKMEDVMKFQEKEKIS
ncbi:TrkA family potassium uptake protein [Candidatus Calescamantes bacterium]|nr:TrkA family potassium uptake protein [Candidatus Calescamantes bacterium]MCK5598996.1 TrkA family potassium uptake protein [bacterium]